MIDADRKEGEGDRQKPSSSGDDNPALRNEGRQAVRNQSVVKPEDYPDKAKG